MLSGNALTSSSWSGWAISGLSSMTSITSKIYRGKPTGGSPKARAPSDATRESPDGETPVKPATDSREASPSKAKEAAEAEFQVTPASGWEDDGWNDDEWGDMDVSNCVWM